MSGVKIRPEEFSKTMMNAIAEYGDEVLEKTETVMKQVTRETVSELKGSAPSGGSYSRGWSHKAAKGGPFKLSETVYNRIYQLTHLLEKPHATGGGGHYPKNVDYTGTIARIEEKNTNRFMEEVLRKI